MAAGCEKSLRRQAMSAIRDLYVNRSAFLSKYASYFDTTFEHWEDEVVSQYQSHALREVVQYVYDNNRFYQKKFDAAGAKPELIQSIDDLSKFPITESSEIKNNPRLLQSCKDDEVALLDVSSGTSDQGKSYSFILKSWDDIYFYDHLIRYDILFPIKQGQIVVNSLAYELSSSGLAMHSVIQNMGAFVIPAGRGGPFSKPESILDIMLYYKPDVYVGLPSIAKYLAEVGKQRGLSLKNDIGLKLLYFGGEGLSPALRKRYEQHWGAPSLMQYGSSETGGIALECSSGNMHVQAGHVIVEVVDPETGAPVPPGTPGDILVTTLLRRGSPVIRYRIGDMGILSQEPCSCGISLPVLKLLGRKKDFLLINEKEYSLYFLEELLLRNEEIGDDYRIKIGRNKLVLQLELQQESNSIALAGRIKESLTKFIDCPIEVEFLPLYSLPRSYVKISRVIYE